MNFLKQHRKNLKNLTKKQLIQQIINHIEITTQMENQFNMAYEKLDNEKQICESELIRTEKSLSDYTELYRWFEKKTKEKENELKETQEALRRNRKLFDGSKELVDRQLLLIKRLERWITNTWYIADSLEVIKELPGWVEEDMIEHKLFDRDQGKYALLLK